VTAEAGGFVPGRHAIEAYGAGGFRFAGMSHRGSILATPKGISAFAPKSLAEIDEESLKPILAELSERPGAIEILVVGAGASFAPAPATLRDVAKRAGLRIEAMATGPAARLYNVLLGEDRRVAALLIAAP
jgi:uncharacterized protein